MIMPVFGTATLPTGTSETSPRGEEGFYRHIGTATPSTGASVASPRGEGGLLTGLWHGDPAYRYLRDIPAWRRGLLTGLRDGTPATGTSEPSPQGHCYLVNRIVAEMGFVKFTWHEPLLIIK